MRLFGGLRSSNSSGQDTAPFPGNSRPRVGRKSLAEELHHPLNRGPLNETLSLCGLPSCPFEKVGQSLRCRQNRIPRGGAAQSVPCSRNGCGAQGCMQRPLRPTGEPAGGASPGHRRWREAPRVSSLGGARGSREAKSEEPGSSWVTPKLASSGADPSATAEQAAGRGRMEPRAKPEAVPVTRSPRPVPRARGGAQPGRASRAPPCSPTPGPCGGAPREHDLSCSRHPGRGGEARGAGVRASGT